MATSSSKYTVVESLNQMIYEDAVAVTAVDSGSDHAVGAHTALYVGVGGNAVVTMQSGNNITFTNLASGQILPIKFTTVVATNTTATNMVALR